MPEVTGRGLNDGGDSGSQAPRVVVAAVITRGGRYLLGLRPPEKRHGGMWEFPGGKLDPRETLLDGVSRELGEELALVAQSIGATLGIIRDPGSEFAIHFVETRVSGDPLPIEHADLRWCTAEELRSMPLAPADAQFAETLLSAAPLTPGVSSPL